MKTKIKYAIIPFLIAIVAIIFIQINRNEAHREGYIMVAFEWNREFRIDANGDLWAWGYNRGGALGVGIIPTTPENMYVYEPVKILSNVVYVAAEGSSGLALKEDGTLWGWGNTFIGPFLDAPPQSPFVSVHFEPVKLMENMKAISAAGNTVMAIKNDNSLWGWGWNHMNPTVLGPNADIRIVWSMNGDEYFYVGEMECEPLFIMDDVQFISLSESSAAAIKTDGSLWHWGGIWKGEIYTQIDWGPRDFPIRQNTLEPIHIMDDVRYVSNGGSHMMIIRNDNSLWAMGWNEHGQLGDGTTEHRLEPVHIMDDVLKVAVAPTHISSMPGYTLALKTDGTLWHFGFYRPYGLQSSDFEIITTPEKILENIAHIFTSNHLRAAAIDTSGNIIEWEH